jgi:phenylalanyl-tRNA synthetase beta chain
MNVSVRWLMAMVPGLELDTGRLAERLALRGAPVEGISSPGAGLADIVVGKVVTAGRHPNADRLTLCTVDSGNGVVQVVCGAPNVKVGAFYPFAPVGSVLPGDFKLKRAKIRGEVSEGMLCSAKELGLGTDHTGILQVEGDFTPGESFIEALGLDDDTLDVEVTPNRGDLLSHIGVARELAAEGEGRVVLPAIPGEPGIELAYVEGAPAVESRGVSIRIDDPDLCSRYLGAVIRGVTIAPSPPWLEERLRGAGARPINNVVDATNYVLLEMGQPLHAFDLGRLAGSGIVVRRAGGQERKFTTLDETERDLDPDMLMICDVERPVAIAGVMGGLHSEVEDKTTEVLLECALFDPKSIRGTRKALGMSTDASYRFERGVDPEGMRQAVERCVAVILATAGGEVDGPVLDCRPVDFEPPIVPLRVSRAEHLLGIFFEAADLRRLLTPLGFEVVDQADDTLQVRVPGYRSYDVTREVDLIEEVARAHGYDEFPAELGPYRPGTVPDDPMFVLEDELRAALASWGLLEAHTPAFAPEGEGDVEIANPLATTEPYMRSSLLPALLRRVEHNLARGNRDVRLFEIGTSFRRAGSGKPPHEETHVAAVLTGRSAPPHWTRDDVAYDVWDLKGLLEDVSAKAYRGGARVHPAFGEVGPRLDAGLSFTVVDASRAVLGHGGRVADGVVDAPAWAGDVWALELRLPAEVSARPVIGYVPPPHLPSVERDLALLVPHRVTAEDVVSLIGDAAGGELEALELFDLYTGEGISEATRSLAFRLRFRSRERTLKDKEVDKAVKTVLRRLQEELGVEARG